MSHIVFCWELGADLGHLGPWVSLATEMRASGQQVSCILKDCTHALQLLGPLGIKWYPAPVADYPKRKTLPANHAQMMDGLGYGDPSHLAGLILAWCNLLQLLQAERVVADSAPTAMLAARILGLPIVSLNSGFHAPPLTDPLPAFRPWLNVPEDELREYERRTLARINQALDRLGGRNLENFRDLYRAETLYRTWPEINPFGPHSHSDHYGPVDAPTQGVAPRWPQGTGGKVFAYLKGEHPLSESVLDALVARGFRVLAYLPNFRRESLERLQRSGRVAISLNPVNLQLLDDDLAMVASHAGNGLLARFADLGQRMLLVPQHLEQILNARAAEEASLPVFVCHRRGQDLRAGIETLSATPRRALPARSDRRHELIGRILGG